MKPLFLLSLMSVLYGTAMSASQEFFYNSQNMDLNTAKKYCEKNYENLAIITTQEEYAKAVIFTPTTTHAWIGLNRTRPHVNRWQWSNGDLTGFTRWAVSEPNDQGLGEDCVVMNMNGWNDVNCLTTTSGVICSGSFMLVKEMKTWEEALQHCRTHYTDLAFVNTLSHLEYFRTQLKMETRSVSLWTGLHFVDRKWFWVNGVPMERLVSLPPQCPIRPYHCGAYNFHTDAWENRDCNEKFHFVCYG